MKKMYIILFLFSFLKFSFGQDYFPLEIGNWWIYQRMDSRGGVDRFEIIDTTRINGNMYYVFNLQYSGVTVPSGYYSYYRIDENQQVRSLSIWDTTETIEYQLDIPEHGYWFLNENTEWEVKITLEDKGYTQFTYAGALDSCYYYIYDAVHLYTTYAYWLAPNIGLIRRETEGESAIFKSAWVNGVAYGDTTDVDERHESQDDNIKNDIFVNYPNPFNQYTVFSYQVPQKNPSSRATLKIYDILGHTIRTLVDEYQSPGMYQIYWNGKDNNNNSIGSGMYFSELTVNNIRTTLKVTLIK